jgi:predicted DCC family thiol-disulfide oxidoreductase YuxK
LGRSLGYSGVMHDANALVIVFDGSCRFCQNQMRWIRQRDKAGRFEFVPSQTENLTQRFPVLAGQDMATGLRVILPDGSAHSGADAVYAIARRLPRWRWPALIYPLPGLRSLFRALYGWIAARRYRLAGRCDDACKI